ncbi:hypothetical protein [Streptomyces milbemycinicus]|uniref:DUF5082 domain-containing protein n=1 Tax=Streptomyces milbemycinicus TaxID=476552 RepID=A0ABW8LX48_9ACTN
MADGDLQARKRELQEKIDQAQGTLNRIQALSNEYWGILASACAAMNGGAWFGPQGRAFGAAAAAHQGELRGSLTEAVESAQRKVAELRAELSALR